MREAVGVIHSFSPNRKTNFGGQFMKHDRGLRASTVQLIADFYVITNDKATAKPWEALGHQ